MDTMGDRNEEGRKWREQVRIEAPSLYYGFPVFLLSTADAEGRTNLTPLSSSWSLHGRIVIGLGTDGKACENLAIRPEAVLNLASPDMEAGIERIARFTAKDPVPPKKREMGYLFAADKFERGGFTPQPSVSVGPERVRESRLQIEAKVAEAIERDGFLIVELTVAAVHASPEILKEDGKIDADLWKPLIYNFRSYHEIGQSLDRNFRFEN